MLFCDFAEISKEKKIGQQTCLTRHNAWLSSFNHSPYRGLKMRLSFWESSFQWVEVSAMPTITITTITTSRPLLWRLQHRSSSFHTTTPCHRSFLQW